MLENTLKWYKKNYNIYKESKLYPLTLSLASFQATIAIIVLLKTIILFINIVGYLNEWIKDSQNMGHQVFLGADSKFLDAVADPELSPLSQDKWNLWMKCSASDKGKVDPSSGLRTDLDLSFDRPLPKSLLPALTGDHILMCIDHGFTRVAENLIMKVVRTCLDLESRLVY